MSRFEDIVLGYILLDTYRRSTCCLCGYQACVQFFLKGNVSAGTFFSMDAHNHKLILESVQGFDMHFKVTF